VVCIGAVKERLDLAIFFNPPILTHPEKDDAVNRELNSKVKLLYGKFRVSYSDFFSQGFTPRLDLF
jgi:hypothetical protein